MRDKIEAILRRDDAFQISFSTSILPGRARCAMLMTTGKGEWKRGYGETVEAALDDLIGQLEGGVVAPKPEVATFTLPGMEMMTR